MTSQSHHSDVVKDATSHHSDAFEDNLRTMSKALAVVGSSCFMDMFTSVTSYLAAAVTGVLTMNCVQGILDHVGGIVECVQNWCTASIRIQLYDNQDSFLALIAELDARAREPAPTIDHVQLVRYRIAGTTTERRVPINSVRIDDNTWIIPRRSGSAANNHNDIDTFEIRTTGSIRNCEQVLESARRRVSNMEGIITQYEWNGEMWLSRSVSALPESVLRGGQQQLVEAMRNTQQGGALLYGPSGAGKSTAIKTACKSLGRPLYVFPHEISDQETVNAKTLLPDNAVLFLDNWDHARMWNETSTVDDGMSYPCFLTLLDSLGPEQWVCMAVNDKERIEQCDGALLARHRIQHRIAFKDRE